MRDILDGIDDLAFVELDAHDVVRHKIVQDIVDAYERDERRHATTRGGYTARTCTTCSRPTSSRASTIDLAAVGAPRRASCWPRSGCPADAEVSVLFVDEQAITDLNERFLGGDGPTDVLAFPIDDDHVPSGRQPDVGRPGPGHVDRAGRPAGRPRRRRGVPDGRRPARRRRTAATLDDELALLVVHGVLHLLNYDHADEPRGGAMQRRERELLERFRAAREAEGRSRWAVPTG